MAAEHLFVASGLGLFRALGDGHTLEELARRLGVPAQTAGSEVCCLTASECRYHAGPGR